MTQPPDEAAARAARAGDPGGPGTAGSPSDPPLDAFPCGLLTCGDDGVIERANGALGAMLGVPAATLVGRPLESLLSLPSRIFYQTHLQGLIRLEGRVDEVFVTLRRDDAADVGALLSLRRHERGGRRVYDGVLLEVRERRKFEDALLRARRDADAARALAEERERELRRTNELLEQQALELELQQQQLQEQAAELEASSERLHEINDLLQARTDALERQRARADDANRAKSQFLATMSHELRTPLNAIGGYAQLLELGIHGPVTPEQHEAIARIQRSQRHLLRLVNDVLNLARIESGRVDYRLEDVRVGDVVHAVLPMVEPQLQAHGLACAVHVDEGVAVRADREKLQQVLLNLLTNAVKFTPAGGVVTVDAPSRQAAPPGQVYLRVSDTGIGIPRDKLDTVFEPFVQVDSTYTRQHEGTGLGLAISRDLVRGMGGDLRARSAPGAGSAFTIALPSAAAAPAA